MMKLESHGNTDVGRKRAINEDAYLDWEQAALFVVADGMGGHAGGEVASRMAVDIVKEFVQEYEKRGEITWPFGLDTSLPMEANILCNAIKLANREIYAKASSDFSVTGMGTTIVVLFIRNGLAYIAHVGDSRAYLVRNSSIYRLTADHSWVGDQVKVGNLTEEQARSHPMRNVITRALGTQEEVDVDTVWKKWNSKDYFILCTDGLTTHLEDSDIVNTVHRSNGSVNDVTNLLIGEANNKGGEDNITVVVVRLAEGSD